MCYYHEWHKKLPSVFLLPLCLAILPVVFLLPFHLCKHILMTPVPGLAFHTFLPPLTSLPPWALYDYSLITWTGKLFLPLCRCCDPPSSSLCYNCLCLKTPSLIASGVSRSADGDISASCSDSPPMAVFFTDTRQTLLHLPEQVSRPEESITVLRRLLGWPLCADSPFLSLCLSLGFYFPGPLTLTEDWLFGKFLNCKIRKIYCSGELLGILNEILIWISVVYLREILPSISDVVSGNLKENLSVRIPHGHPYGNGCTFVSYSIKRAYVYTPKVTLWGFRQAGTIILRTFFINLTDNRVTTGKWKVLTLWWLKISINYIL